MENIDVRALDWDDSDLLRAYAKSFNDKNVDKRGKNLQSKADKKRKWKVGDYCRAVYSGDDFHYEAKVISLNGDFCKIEFLGYGDQKEVDLLELKESKGKKARQYQIAESQNYPSAHDDSVEEFSDVTETSCSSTEKKRNWKKTKKPANNATLDRTATYEATFHQHYSGSARTPRPKPANLPFMPPPPPMMPQCPSSADNPSLAAMVTSWYLTGYYTGIRVATTNQGCHHCCNHSSHCSR